VQFGEPREYHYHCLRCWRQVAEQVVAAYVERTEA
jgi:DNA-directed RNA polymerase subunit RPC12/RpoP